MLNTKTITFSTFLKGQLVDFVDNYKKYFLKTLGITLALTIICFAGAALLQRFSTFSEHTMSTKPISIIDNLFQRYSNSEIYSFVDLTKTFFIFLIAFFSIALTRFTSKQDETKKLSFDNFISNIKFRDLCLLIGVFCIASIFDFALVKLFSLIFNSQIFSYAIEYYIRNVIFHIRLYLPLILFASTIHYMTATIKTKISWKNVIFLYISVWLFNEFAYEFSIWIRSFLYGIILLPVEDQYRFYLFESILGIPLIALFFLGYHTAMTYPFKQEEENEIDETENIEV